MESLGLGPPTPKTPTWGSEWAPNPKNSNLGVKVGLPLNLIGILQFFLSLMNVLIFYLITGWLLRALQ